MRGAENIISVFDSLISQMTPVITITANVVDGDNWKLSTCNTYWATTGMVVTIGGEDYRIESFVKDDYVIVSGDAQPVGASFQLEAPEFWHGSRRKVNNERSDQIDVTRWVAYLPIPRVTENNDPEIDFVYEADLRPLFVFAYDEQLDTIEHQQTNVIEPANAMADFYLWLVNDQEENFNTPEDIERYEWMNFGDETIWGKDKLIFDAPLSGVELRHTLQIMPDGVCQCDDATPITCMPAQIYINGVYEDEAPSGQDFLLIVEDTNGDPQGVYDEPTKTLVVPAGSGGTIDVDVNGVPFYVGVSSNQDLPVKDSTGLADVGSKVLTQWIISDSSVNVKDSAGATLYAKTVKAEATADQVVTDSTVNVKDSAGNILYAKTVKAQATENQTVADVTQTVNGSSITNNKAETSKAITIRYANNDPVVVTTITDTEAVFIGEVPDVVIQVNTALPYKSGAITSLYGEDDGETEIGRGSDWYTLTINNHFGTTKRFTGITGGYQSGGNYFDVNNNATTQILAFPDSIVIDWAYWDKATGQVMWWYNTPFSATATNALANQPYTLVGHADWRVPNVPQLRTLMNYEFLGVGTLMNYNPFNYSGFATANRFWTCNPIAALGNILNFSGGDSFTNNSVGTTCRVLAFRLGNISEL